MRRLALLLWIACLSAPGVAHAEPVADPMRRSPGLLDPHRPPEAENRLTVPDGFTLGLAGDMIIARPLSQARNPVGFDAALSLLRAPDVTFGNLETSIIDIRDFKGAPYPFDGDWANISQPSVAADIQAMGFDIVGRANNHALDWGIEGMRETGKRLDDAGIVHAGTGETRDLARAPTYLETPKGRIAILSFATTFRPASEATPAGGGAPARPGISALHLTLRVHVTADAMKALTWATCIMDQTHCGDVPAVLALRGTTYVRDTKDFNEWVPDSEDMGEILRSVREARQHADLVLVAVHSHECEWNCDSTTAPQLPGAFLKDVAHAMIDAGADIFATTGIHNLGPIEIYHDRPIFYGLSNFFWSDIQEPVPHELYQLNRAALSAAYRHPERVTDYDLTAVLNAGSFANAYTFQSVFAEVRFGGGRLTTITLHPMWLGYGEDLRTSGTPRPDPDPARARDTIDQILQRSKAYRMPALPHTWAGGAAIFWEDNSNFHK